MKMKFVKHFVFLMNIFVIVKGENHVNESLSEFVPSNSSDYAIAWANGSVIRLNSSLLDHRVGFTPIDCFGLGSTVAETLQWLFAVQGDPAKANDVRFYYSSRKQRQRVRLITGEQFGLEWTDFNVERRTVFIVHGFLSSASQAWVKRMEEAFLLWDDVNVVAVDWSARGNSYNYVKAVVNTRTVGNEIARLLHQIVNTTIAATGPSARKLGPLHMVGHSLGAHICGFAANAFQRRQSVWKVSRITGLDPANRCFSNVRASLRLNTEDAAFVDIIHTNGRSDELFSFGSPQSIGHVDFYPNGGKRQPGCSLHKGLLPEIVTAPQTGICSHGYSYAYFTDSLISASSKNCTFWAHRWDRSYRRALQLISEVCNPNNCTEMGINAEKYSQRGTFFVATSRAPPFCVTDAESREEVRQQLQIDYASEILD
ncbi:phospholipase A1 1-like [Venturia canescens]|uniref:phospholipase A1 1-like n=1 Tax=Venturia canescens TaxID=32260 RepID=UPI001C9C2859|nr:phospholipase A1 1-like [Venturia canescens]XP_043273796.1 phospholipase A1 1-like [Venturia canescens]